MTIVPANKLQDPQHLLYNFPSIHPVRYQKMSREYYYWKIINTVEQAVKMLGHYLVPGNCIHYERKQQLKSRRVIIQKKVFYVLEEKEMTKVELSKFKDAVRED